VRIKILLFAILSTLGKRDRDPVQKGKHREGVSIAARLVSRSSSFLSVLFSASQ
jgi:hypothetical protein